MRAAVALLLAASLLAACSSGVARRSSAGRLSVVAGESPWGSIAAAIGGEHVAVTSLLSAPGADPHEYQPTAEAAAAVATASVVIENGLGYDRFLERMLAQGSTGPRRVVVAAEVLGVDEPTANPHLWYAVERVPVVAASIEAALAAADPRHAASYRRGLERLDAGLSGLDASVLAIRSAHRGAKVLVTERLADYLLAEAGLDIASPSAFARSVESGESPSAAATAQMRSELSSGRASALVLNAQVLSPAARSIRDLARSAGVPVVPMTETVQPVGSSYVSWQSRQVAALSRALRRAS